MKIMMCFGILKLLMIGSIITLSKERFDVQICFTILIVVFLLFICKRKTSQKTYQLAQGEQHSLLLI